MYIYIYIDIYAPSRSGDFCNCLLVYRSLSLSSKGAINAPHNNKSHSYSQSYSFSYRGELLGKSGDGIGEYIDNKRGYFQRPATYWRRHFDAVCPFVCSVFARKRTTPVCLALTPQSPSLSGDKQNTQN